MIDPHAWAGAPFTYPEVGATASTPPADAHAIVVERVVGAGRTDFATSAEFILAYGMQRGAGLRVHASTPAAAVGTIMVMSAPAFGRIRIPCRVVYVLDEPDRAGFAYGTLAGHPESGEELFSVEHRADDSVVAVIRAFSRPGRWYTRLGGPLVRAVQAATTRRYLAAVADAVGAH
ncbi:DUF1990 domain-containing protein [Gordonia sp. VNQ95]|jgi:uncharacterized protein (UPF0548 family)|uniref:DUF1990 family protein n=1 Tax=Gordonia TaxID=2053 RepID=UPI0032B375F4